MVVECPHPVTNELVWQIDVEIPVLLGSQASGA